MLRRALLVIAIVHTSIAMAATDRPRFRIPALTSLFSRYEPTIAAHSWENFVFEEPERLIAIGDLHADYPAAVQILRKMNLIDRAHDWVGGEAVVVQLGDFLGRGPESRKLMDLLMKLEIQADHAGGKVIALLGNHEALAMVGNYSTISIADGKSFFDLIDYHGPTTETKLIEALDFALSERSAYGQWILGRPTAVKVGRRLFVHAGVERWIEKLDISRLNATVRAWLQYYQNKRTNQQPPPGTDWVLGMRGPLQTRALSRGMVDPERYFEWLSKLSLDAVVVGHTKIHDYSLMTENPRYGGKFLMLDTGISEAKGGLPSAVEFRKGEAPTASVFTRAQLYRHSHN